MGQVHRYLGLTVGCVLADMEHDDKKAAYDCDITYITNNELGFDYLRDNMVVYKEQLVQRGLSYCCLLYTSLGERCVEYGVCRAGFHKHTVRRVAVCTIYPGKYGSKGSGETVHLL